MQEVEEHLSQDIRLRCSNQATLILNANVLDKFLLKYFLQRNFVQSFPL